MPVDLTSCRLLATKPKGRVARELTRTGIQIEPVTEDFGNVDRFIVSKHLVIERLTPSGFLRAIMDKTLFSNAIFLRRHYRLSVLILEGRINYTYTNFDPQATRGALTSMVIEYAMNVLQTADIDETVALIAMMTRQEQLGIPEISFVPKRSTDSFADMQRRVVEMLPGCGRVTARNLLQHFGSIDRIVEATDLELRAIRGIGAKTARTIGKVLAAEYRSVDTEMQLEDAIEADPSLLFDHPVQLIERQHHILDDDRNRHIVDMIFFDPTADRLILVELKLGRLVAEHREQLRRYLDCARSSGLVRRRLDAGSGLHGVLASFESSKIALPYPDITTMTVDRERAIEVLTALRRKRWGKRPADGQPDRVALR